RDADQNTISTQQSKNFASWLLDVGNGLLGDPDVQDPHNTKTIQIPSDFLIQPGDNSIRPLETMVDYTGIMRKHMTGIESEISNIVAGDGGVLAGGVEIVYV
ncbi:hypothetical protein M8C21_019450, partial [Ambrosia artemisiifolia]